MADSPLIARKGPFAVNLVAGKRYFWCACGRSKNQPFCDGSHKVTSLRPVAFVPERDGTMFLCGCKRSRSAPVCDSSHQDL